MYLCVCASVCVCVCVCAELARDFCLRAYELSRTDKQLYVVWPRVMAALGEREKARVSYTHTHTHICVLWP